MELEAARWQELGGDLRGVGWGETTTTICLPTGIAGKGMAATPAKADCIFGTTERMFR
jgi:hypothetical protein